MKRRSTRRPPHVRGECRHRRGAGDGGGSLSRSGGGACAAGRLSRLPRRASAVQKGWAGERRGVGGPSRPRPAPYERSSHGFVLLRPSGARGPAGLCGYGRGRGRGTGSDAVIGGAGGRNGSRHERRICTLPAVPVPMQRAQQYPTRSQSTKPGNLTWSERWTPGGWS